jgi:spore coat protein CotH
MREHKLTQKDEKTEIQGFYRTDKGVLINKDNDALAAYKRRKQREQNIDVMQEEIKSLKDDMKEIKEMLKKVLE